MSDDDLKSTILGDDHRARGGRMVAFAGYSMPVQYETGILKEHQWTRAHAGAFDVSHMGPAFLELTAPGGDPEANHRAIADLIEPLVCGDIAGLKRGQLRYTLLLNEVGGIIDDLMIGRPTADEAQGSLYLVVNAGTKEGDFALIEAAAGDAARLRRADDGALIALQGPEAEAALASILPGVEQLAFMRHTWIALGQANVAVSRSGYTGEDGFEILCPAPAAGALWARLLADPRVLPIGLGARDSLRLEAGLPLYGHDADETTSPFETALGFAVSKARLKAGRLRGATRLAAEMKGALGRVRVGLRVLAGAPAREGAEIATAEGSVIGRVTSGGFSPTLGAPIAMGFVPPVHATPGTSLGVIVRGRTQPAEVASLPFFAHRYRRATPVA